MEISFIHMQILVHLHVNKTNFHMKGFTLGLALKQIEAKDNSEIVLSNFIIWEYPRNTLEIKLLHCGRGPVFSSVSSY